MDKTASSLFLLLAVLTAQGAALRCHTCASGSNAKCSDPFEAGDSWQLDCGFTQSSKAVPELLHEHFPGVYSPSAKLTIEPVCFKSVYTKLGVQTTFRSCSFFGENTCTYLREATEADGGTMDYCQSCSDELCNSGPRAGAMALCLLLAAPLVMILKSL